MQWGMGIQHYFANDNAAAAPAFSAPLELYRKVGDRTQEAWSLHQLGLSLLKLGRHRRGRSPVGGGLRLFTEAGDVAGVTLGLDNFSAVAAADGDLATGSAAVGARPAHPGLVRHRPRRGRRDGVRGGRRAQRRPA